ncbi:MAG: hypothetical protein QNJ51_13910 [Calothrix sp. MO_167.B12]|nr:hypothetical protein [Calothrix sp. MO_167.B12]
MARVKGTATVRHIVGTGTKRFVINLSDVYSAIGTAVGVSKLTGDIPDDVPSLDYDGASRNGRAAKVRISYKKTGTTKLSQSNILVAVDKLDTALTDLVGKAYNGGTIVSARFPRRRILR